MRIATWNVNSVRQRLPHLLAYLKEFAAGRGAKCRRSNAPTRPSPSPWNWKTSATTSRRTARRSYNGVAILSKTQIEDVERGLPRDLRRPARPRGTSGAAADEQARYIEGTVVRVAALYLPNGNPIGTEKYTYSFSWRRGSKPTCESWRRRTSSYWRRLQRHPTDATLRSGVW